MSKADNCSEGRYYKKGGHFILILNLPANLDGFTFKIYSEFTLCLYSDQSTKVSKENKIRQ